MIDLKGKKVLITGATGGIGGSLVKKFLSLNAEVLGTGTNSEKLDKLKRSIELIKNCKLKKSANKIVFGDGNINAKIMIIGEKNTREKDNINNRSVIMTDINF